ncbi:MAG: hypothetical protein LBQ66_15120, partial [Planctomycetaceae bacterium]|nr:hypothetical protein [Planctomycetaceae bacterium]
MKTNLRNLVVTMTVLGALAMFTGKTIATDIATDVGQKKISIADVESRDFGDYPYKKPYPAKMQNEERLNCDLYLVIRETEQIKQGSTREALLKRYRETSGLTKTNKQTFVHRSSPLIKIDVEWNRVDEKEYQKSDTIKSISKPYLAITTEKNFEGYPFWKGNVVKYLPECQEALKKLPVGVATRKNVEEYFRQGGGITTATLTRY